jgi:hypothetical protein
MNLETRITKLEKGFAADRPARFVFAGQLERGERPGPGQFTFELDDPQSDRRETSK